MKRLALVVALIVIAGIAGIVRSHSRSSELSSLVSRDSAGEARDEIRQSFELAPGAQVEVTGINGSVKVETSDTTTADVFVERTGASAETLNRRKVTVEGDANGLRIRGTRGSAGFWARLFGSNPAERVTLKVPRNISLRTNGINGSVIVGDLDGSIAVQGVNGRVQIASASGNTEFRGINGNIQVGLKSLDALSLSGVNGNIELQLGQGINADLDAHGMNGRLVSDLAEVTIEKGRHGNYSARIGSGGNAITAHGINGNIRLTRGNSTIPVSADATGK